MKIPVGLDRTMNHLFALTLLIALAAPGALAYDLDFGADVNVSPLLCSSTLNGLGALVACSDGAAISQTYGDVAEVVDVTYSAPLRSGESLHWWAENYNNLYGVAYAGGSNADSKARIELRPLAPNTQVNLSSFDLGSYFKTSLATNIHIYAIGAVTPLFTISNISVGNGGQSASTFTPNVSSAIGLWIEWQNSAYNVAIDNVRFTVTAVIDEPDSTALLLCGLVVLGWAARTERAGTARSGPLLGEPHRCGA
jgi:hypothetical protein